MSEIFIGIVAGFFTALGLGGRTTLIIFLDIFKDFSQHTLQGINLIFFVVLMVIIKLGAMDYMRFIWVEFFKFLGVLCVALLLIFFIFIYPKTKLKNSKIFKSG